MCYLHFIRTQDKILKRSILSQRSITSQSQNIILIVAVLPQLFICTQEVVNEGSNGWRRVDLIVDFGVFAICVEGCCLLELELTGRRPLPNVLNFRVMPPAGTNFFGRFTKSFRSSQALGGAFGQPAMPELQAINPRQSR